MQWAAMWPALEYLWSKIIEFVFKQKGGRLNQKFMGFVRKDMIEIVSIEIKKNLG